jgi:hypothetical protein
MSDNEICLLIKYIKSVLWRIAKRLSYIEDAGCKRLRRVNPVVLNHKVSNELGHISQGTPCVAEYEAKYISKGMFTRAGHEARSNLCRTPVSVLFTHRCEPNASFVPQYFFTQESLNSAHHVGFSGMTTFLDSGP